MKTVDLAYWPAGKGILANLARSGHVDSHLRQGTNSARGRRRSRHEPLQLHRHPSVRSRRPQAHRLRGQERALRASGPPSSSGPTGRWRSGAASPTGRARRMRETVRENDLLGLFIEGTRQERRAGRAEAWGGDGGDQRGRARHPRRHPRLADLEARQPRRRLGGVRRADALPRVPRATRRATRRPRRRS